MPRVDVVIPNWNGRDLLAALLPTLDAQTFTDFHVIVVDNGSQDESLALLAAHPAIQVLALSENIGFAPAVNRGVAAGHGEYVALLNNDMELDPRWLEALVAALDADPRLAAATPKQLMLREPGRIDGAGDVLAWTGGATRRGAGELDRGQYDAAGPVFSASGGAALFRRAAIDDVGPLDESFFAYLEDVDWGLRAALRGWTTRYEPAAVVHHLGGATSRRVPGRERHLIARNHVAVLVKDFPGRWLARFAPLIAAEFARMLVSALAARQAGFVLRGWREALLRLPASLRARRAIQAGRTVSLDTLELTVFGARRTRRDLLSVRPRVQPAAPVPPNASATIGATSERGSRYGS